MSENPTPEAVAAIVKGLTKAQREAVLFIGRGPYDHGISLFSTFWHRSENDGLLKVIRHDLALTSCFAPDARGDGMGPVERLTPLGLAVRQALTGEPK